MSVEGSCHSCRKKFYAIPNPQVPQVLQNNGFLWAVCPHCFHCPECGYHSNRGTCPSKLPWGTTALESDADDALKVVVGLTQRLFDADDKDVTFKLKDGTEKAHRLVLSAASDVFKSMFGHGMREKDGAIELDDVDSVSMRVFLRILYTGHVCEDDWAGEKGTARRKTWSSAETAAPPLQVLLSALRLARKYMCQDVMSLLTQAVKGRLIALREGDSYSVSVFEQIMAGAIQLDIGPLRMAALQKAKTFTGLKRRYDAKQLRPEVQFELEAIWPTPSSPATKRKRIV